MSEWQPIETAPVGVWLLFLDGEGVIREALNGQRHHVDMRLSGRDKGSTVNAYMHCYTHWMPLPAAIDT